MPAASLGGIERSHTCLPDFCGENGDLSFRGTDVDKPDVLCELLQSHGISLCCISEHRWKGEGTIVCGDYMYVFSGLPETAPKAMQGVAVCMNAEMQRAWRAAGQLCRYEGGRLLHVKLLLHDRVVNVVAVYLHLTLKLRRRMLFMTNCGKYWTLFVVGKRSLSWAALMHEWVYYDTLSIVGFSYCSCQ